VDFYLSVFQENSQVLAVSRYTEAGPGPAGTVLTLRFLLCGQEMMALNGGPLFRFNEALSLVVNCEDQKEMDYYWDQLGEGGEPGPCGWLKDKYGLSWQIVPKAFEAWMDPADPERNTRVMRALLQMGKLELAALTKAAEG